MSASVKWCGVSLRCKFHIIEKFQDFDLQSSISIFLTRTAFTNVRRMIDSSEMDKQITAVATSQPRIDSRFTVLGSWPYGGSMAGVVNGSNLGRLAMLICYLATATMTKCANGF